MVEVKTPDIMSREGYEALNENKDSLKFIFEPEDGEIVCEGGNCYIKGCSKIDKVKFVLCNVTIDVKKADCDDNGLKEEICRLRKLLYMKRRQMRRFWEYKQNEDEKLRELIKEFTCRTRQILSIYRSLKRHEQITVNLEAWIEGKIEVYRSVSAQCRKELYPELKQEVYQLKRRLYREHTLIEKIKRVLVEKVEGRKNIEKIINMKTDGVFEGLFTICGYATNDC